MATNSSGMQRARIGPAAVGCGQVTVGGGGDDGDGGDDGGGGDDGDGGDDGGGDEPPAFDPGLVTLVDGSCSITPRTISAGDTAFFEVDVQNQNTENANVTVAWESSDGTELTRATDMVFGESSGTVLHTASSGDIFGNIPQGTYDVRARKVSTTQAQSQALLGGRVERGTAATIALPAIAGVGYYALGGR